MTHGTRRSWRYSEWDRRNLQFYRNEYGGITMIWKVAPWLAAVLFWKLLGLPNLPS